MNITHPFVRVYQDCALCAVHRKDHLLIMVTKCKSAIENEGTCAHDTMKEKGENIADNGKSEGGSVWSECPNHILERMFPTLEMQHIARFRMVCKEWNMLLSSSEFLSPLPERNSWILLCSESHDMAFCFLTHSWKTISLGFLPSQTAENHSQVYSRSCSKSGAGLLLLEITQPQKTYTIYNPLTAFTKIFPQR